MNNPVKVTSEQLKELANLCYFFAQKAEQDGINPNTLEVCQLEARLNYHEQEGQWDRYEDTLNLIKVYLKRGRSERFVDRGLIWNHDKPLRPTEELEPEFINHFKDIGRKIDINWGGDWNTRFGSMAIKNIWEEELKLSDFKFYESREDENEDLSEGNWQSIAQSHAYYFTKTLTDIMRKNRETLTFDEAKAVAMKAICEFAKKISEDGEGLKSGRFATAAYNWVWYMYRLALDSKDVINMKPTRQKLEDQRTLNNVLKELKGQLFRTPTIDEICKSTGWGETRVNSTFRLFDFHIGYYRPMNEEEMLYTVMDDLLTERQAAIVEMSYGLGGITPMSLPDIAEDLGIGRNTAQSERAKAMAIIKEELSFKYEDKRRL